MKTLETAETLFLEPYGAKSSDLENILSGMLSCGADAADIYFQRSVAETWSLEDGIVKHGSFHQEQGVGFRTMAGEKTGLAYTEDLHLPALRLAADTSRQIVRSGKSAVVPALHGQRIQQRYPDKKATRLLSAQEVMSILRYVDQTARAKEPLARQVMASFSFAEEDVMIAASDGTWAADYRPLCRLNVSVIIERDGRRERGSAGGGGRSSPAKLFLTDNGRPSSLVDAFIDEAIRQARVNLEAKPAPAGVMPVVLGPGWPGVLLHEAVGHGLEGDFNRRGSSTYSDKMGELVASELCTVVDDGTLSERRGSLTVDDEGTPSQCTVLIDKGRLVGYMQDKRNARLMGSASTGNGRRESYAHLTMPRMTNTYMLAGEDEPDDIIRSVRRGLYAPNFGGGQVDITSGQFVFSASEAYLIEDGKITTPVKGATLIGNGPEVLKKVSMVGHDLALDAGVGVCGKEGQSVPVGVGQPTLKIDELLVGGTESP